MALSDASSGGGGCGGCLLFILGAFLGVPLLVVTGMALPGPPSIETGVFTLALLLLVIGALVAPWRNSRPMLLTGLVLSAGVLGYRYYGAASGQSVHSSTGPHGGEGRWLDRMVPERDVALAASGLLAAAELRAGRELLEALRDGYGRMRAAEGPVPSPLLSTILVGQTPEEHSVLRIAPPRYEPPESVLVFLHGWMGNLTLLCWQIAQGANPVGVDVLCPSTSWDAAWTEPEGRRTVEETLASLRARGVRRIYLAGFSAGATGASRLAPELDVDGLILISGAPARERRPGKPTLVLQGALDRTTPAAGARAYARRSGATYEEHPEAGSWLILSHPEWAVSHLRRWLAEREGLGGIRTD